MKLLLVAATPFEIGPLTEYLSERSGNGSDGAGSGSGVFKTAEHEVQLCITGVGLTATTYALTKALAKGAYDMVLQVGVGGSFDAHVPLGSLHFVKSEAFADLGAEDHNEFLDLFTMGLHGKDKLPFTDGRLVNPLVKQPFGEALPEAVGITVHTVSGSEGTIAKRKVHYPDAVLESMEGAALHYVCLLEEVPFMQVRAVSNYVTPRDKTQWQMGKAIKGLNEWLINQL